MNYFLLFVILLVISETPLSSSTPELYRNCSNLFKCGNLTADFPFWGGDQRPRECGHPGLKLRCDYHDNTTILEIIGVRYRVLEIHQQNKTLKIAREDYEPGICPQNTALDATLFVGAPGYVNFTLLHDCPSSVISNFSKHETANFNCGLKSPYGIIPTMGFFLPGDTGPMGCLDCVTVLVREHRYSSTEEIEQALKDGFELQWEVDHEGYCQKCNASKGKCGIENLNETVCYCQEPQEPSSSFQECLPLPHDGK